MNEIEKFLKECRALRLKGATSEQWEYAEKLGQACIYIEQLQAKLDAEKGEEKMDKKYAVPLTEWNKLVEQKIRLEKALDYAKSFIDGYGAARIEESLGREGMDAILKEIDKIVNPTDICPICGDEKPVSDLHRNCGK